LPRCRTTPILPPAPPWRGASLNLLTRTDDPLITPSEVNDLTDTPSYDETIAYLRKLPAKSASINLVVFGQTAQGRDLYLVVATKEGAKTAAEVVKNGRPTLLAQAGIHSGEIDGKDAGLMLLRDIATGRKSALLERANSSSFQSSMPTATSAAPNSTAPTNAGRSTRVGARRRKTSISTATTSRPTPRKCARCSH